jgi:hypothetical protein
MKDITVIANLQVTRIFKNVPDCFKADRKKDAEIAIANILREKGLDVIVEDVKIFEMQAKDIKVGDIVILFGGIKAVVLDQIEENMYYVLNENGCVEKKRRAEFAKASGGIDISVIMDILREG